MLVLLTLLYFHKEGTSYRRKVSSFFITARITSLIGTMTVQDKYFLGFDLSTQQLKCLAINQSLKLVSSQIVDFDRDLPHYKTHKGVYVNGSVVDCPVAMWVEALDLVFQKFKDASFDLSKVVAISGSCQQHGSVYWSDDAGKLLGQLDSARGSLVDQLVPDAFSRATAPNWQDHSTAEECKELEAITGGPQGMANVTGSRAHLRFTGAQILKIAKHESETYSRTATIGLVSNFLASLLCGKLVPLEEADACGMNLYDIPKRKFNDKLLNCVDSQSGDSSKLYSKLLGDPVSCDNPTRVGTIADYFVSKYGFCRDCSIYPITGDNLATICSLPLKKDDVLISLGTSTTVLIVTDQFNPSPNYHMFIHPTVKNHYMGMICYCNGALAREIVRDKLNAEAGHGEGWELFDKAVQDPSVDTSNELGVYFPLAEIVPNATATCKRVIFDPSTGDIVKQVDSFADRRHDAKNIVESQALSCRVRIVPLLGSSPTTKDNTTSSVKVKFDYSEAPLSDYLTRRPKRVFFTGGASKNSAIIGKFAEILGATEGTYRLENPNSCALGGCYKALWSQLYNDGETTETYDVFLNKCFPWDTVESITSEGVKSSEWEQYNEKIVPLSHLEESL